jgi:hydrogenase-4 component F
MTWALILLLVLPLAATAAALVVGWRAARAATLASGLAVFALTIAVAVHVADGAEIVTAHGWLRLDPLGAVFLVATGLLYAATAAFSIGYLAGHAQEPRFDRYARRYFALLNLFAWTMVLVPLAADFGTLWVAIELTTIVSALLVAIDRTDAALEAAWKYVLIASCGLGIALLGIILLYAAGTPVLGEAYLPRFDRLIGAAGSLSDDAVSLAFVLALMGFGTKAGFVPMHTWLPDAHSEAPAPVSALLSGALLAAAFYGALRFFQVAVAAGDGDFARKVLVVFGALSLIAAALFVLRQSNFKRLLAYSSIEHIGLVALGIGFGAPLAMAGALLHVITHASAKGLAFFGAGALLRRYDTKEIDRITGAGRALPWSGPLFMAAALALCGLPISGVFRSEFQIVSGGFQSTDYIGVVLLIVFVNVAFFGVIWHAGRMVLSSPTGAATTPAGEPSHWMVAAMVACVLVVIALGVHVPGDLNQLLDHAVQRLQSP